MSSVRKSGTMMWYSWTKRYGIIHPDTSNKDLCVGNTSINANSFPNIRGMAVEYTPNTDRKGHLRAIDITAPAGGAFTGGRGSGGGHFLRDCTHKGGGACILCFNCGNEGHVRRDCTERGGGAHILCLYCDEEDHFAKYCVNGGGGSGEACILCGRGGYNRDAVGVSRC